MDVNDVAHRKRSSRSSPPYETHLDLSKFVNICALWYQYYPERYTVMLLLFAKPPNP